MSLLKPDGFIKQRISPKLAGLAVDKVIVAQTPGLSRRCARRAIDMGVVFHNGKPVRRAGALMMEGDLLEWQIAAEKQESWSKGANLHPNDILFDDGDLLVLSKPPLLTSEKVRSGRQRHVVEALAQMLPPEAKITLPKLCHRLDRETSGVLVLARKEKTVASIMDAFRQRLVQKTYLAVCRRKPREKTWCTQSHLSSPHRQTGDVRSVFAGGRPSETSFTLKGFWPGAGGLSLIEARPKTGRTHQIRVHCADEGIAILGDRRYGSRYDQERVLVTKTLEPYVGVHHFLHAYKLVLPKGVYQDKELVFQAPLPPRMQQLLEKVGLWPT